jgi:hypothetical protein
VKLLDMLSERRKLRSAMQQMLDLAVTENRDLSAVEKARFTTMSERYDEVARDMETRHIVSRMVDEHVHNLLKNGSAQ